MTNLTVANLTFANLTFAKKLPTFIMVLGAFLLNALLLSSCVPNIRTAPRTELEGQFASEVPITERKAEFHDSKEDKTKLSDKDLEKYAYELGLDPRKGLNDEERKNVLNRRRLRTLERQLETPKERLNYSKVLPLLKTDEEKIEYLSIPSIEGRQSWTNRNKIWNREKTNSDLVDLADAQDIAIGMTQELVRRAWGEPQNVEASGNPIYRNERWKYLREIPTANGYKKERRYVYFEGGQVVGWETEN